ncbi:TIM-barrel domain-containing protein [Spirochaeta isovalerica]|uniref:Alpha-glucosidase n=1 Tax=Spirochaeta isovalerica TaxID=150 RepID=A0A841RCE0_9SPIO|nr:alpha-glucosidase [Spirochaeta isovalerica]
MYFHKIDNPMNFRFPGLEGGFFHIGEVGEGVFSLSVEESRWSETGSYAPFFEDSLGAGDNRTTLVEKNGEIEFSYDGQTLLRSKPQEGFGVCGKKWLFAFDYSDDLHFYGMGEKSNGFEKSGIKTKFWNTDVWSDFPVSEVIYNFTDPMYLSVPYLLVKNGDNWFGILVDNPYPVFMATGAEEMIAKQNQSDTTKDFYIGSTDGKPHIYFIAGKNPGDVTGKLQRLCGTTERPPLWSLGYHQCRWGYKSYEDLKELDGKFTEHQIPCDGLWLDIDYMTGYRVFTWNEEHFSNVRKDIARLNESGRQVVPILDPGVKRDPQYPVYLDGKEKNIFCLNSEGLEYTGFVWPGETMFPDFSMEEGRQWWAEQVARFASEGIKGVWIDMNDPSTGSSEISEMKFRRGERDHDWFHNQYALGMQDATYRGLRKTNPESRPFIMSRSGFTGTSRWSAIWTGDNYSNYHNLQQNIETALNLSISSIPFIGSDVPGFGGDATEELMISWHKAAFLSPILRNHSLKDTRNQEPWAFDDKVLDIVRYYIRQRYKLLPYLYNLFIDQETSGQPLLRPLYYHAGNEEMESLLYIGDQFYIGPSIMQAPVVKEGEKGRDLYLPSGRWFDVQSGSWREGGEILSFSDSSDEKTPLYIRDGAVLPMQPGERTDNNSDLSVVEFHIFADRQSGHIEYDYTYDRGDGYGYREGEQSRFTVKGEASDDTLELELIPQESGYKACRMEFVLYSPFSRVLLTNEGGVKVLEMKKHEWMFAASAQKCWKSEPVQL